MVCVLRRRCIPAPTKKFRHPSSVRTAALHQKATLFVDVIFHALNAHVRSVYEQIGAACITVIRKTYASAVGDSDSAAVTNKRRVDVPINGDGRIQNAVNRLKVGIRRCSKRSAPKVVGPCVYQRKQTIVPGSWKGLKPSDAICPEPFTCCSNDLANAGHQGTKLRGPCRHFF